MTHYTIPEWSHIRVGKSTREKDSVILPDHAAQLEKAAYAAFPKKGGIDHILLFKQHSIKSNDYVGIIGTKDCTLEILPKIDADGRDDQERNVSIRKRLVHMLAVALDTKISEGTLTKINWEQNPILEFLIRVFTEKLFDLVRQGLPRNYEGMERDLSAIRGSLNVVRQFTKHAVNPSRLACRFDELTKDITLNQKMKATIWFLFRYSNDARNQQRLRELMFLYADIELVSAASLKHKLITLDRTNEKWHWLIEMADMLLANQFQSTSGGQNKGFSFLFDMNLLFEKYLSRKIKRAASKLGYVVELQNTEKFCLTDSRSKEHLFKIKPDIVVKAEGKVIHVIDTKWKHLKPKSEDRQMGVSSPDIYQMMTYGQLHDSQRLTLLYPHSSNLKTSEGHQLSGGTVEDRTFSFSTFDLANPDNEEERIQELLRRKATDSGDI